MQIILRMRVIGPAESAPTPELMLKVPSLEGI
jgi:hypothetical protein